MKPKFLYLQTENLTIYEQLQIEEAALRSSLENLCLINWGSPPAIVLGISGTMPEFVDEARFSKRPCDVIKRFSGGGTVVVDEETIFVSFIGQKTVLGDLASPRRMIEWTEPLYGPLFDGHAFSIQENDYTLEGKKFGGNAQYLSKERFLHHTSLLFSYRRERMELLKMPKKTPRYREGRCHESFLCTLEQLFPSKEEFRERFLKSLQNHFNVEQISLDAVLSWKEREHRKSLLRLFKA